MSQQQEVTTFTTGAGGSGKKKKQLQTPVEEPKPVKEEQTVEQKSLEGASKRAAQLSADETKRSEQLRAVVKDLGDAQLKNIVKKRKSEPIGQAAELELAARQSRADTELAKTAKERADQKTRQVT
jgi:hypothetical protein